MSRNFPHLGFDPAPGDVELSRNVARQVSNLAHELGTMKAELGMIEFAGWTGKAAIAFRDHLDTEIAPLIQKSYQSFNDASHSLNGWVNQLQGFQAEADALEREAAAKQGTLDNANQTLKTPSPSPSPSPSSGNTPNPSPSATDHQNQQKQQAVTDANNALTAVRQRAHELHDRYTAAAGTVARTLESAGHIAPPKPGFFSDLLHGVEGAWDATCDWVKQHADFIKAIADVLSDLGAALQILAIICLPFEPLGAIFEGLALAANGLALVGDLVAKAGGANVSWLSIGMSAAGVIPGIGAFAKEAKVAEDGVTAFDRAGQLSEAFGGAVKEGSGTARNWIGKADGVQGGIQFKKIALFGKKTNLETVAGRDLTGRLAVLTEKQIAGGQNLGSAGAIKALGGMKTIIENSTFRKIVGEGSVLNKLDSVGDKTGELAGKIHPTSNVWRGVDASAAAGKLAHNIHNQIPEFREQFGTRFQQLASAA